MSLCVRVLLPKFYRVTKKLWNPVMEEIVYLRFVPACSFSHGYPFFYFPLRLCTRLYFHHRLLSTPGDQKAEISPFKRERELVVSSKTTDRLIGFSTSGVSWRLFTFFSAKRVRPYFICISLSDRFKGRRAASTLEQKI